MDERKLIKVERQRDSRYIHDVSRLVQVNETQCNFVWAARVRVDRGQIGILRGQLTTAELATMRRNINRVGPTKVFEVRTF